jgi:hypothetical protein
MATLIQQPASFSFSSAVDDIIFATSEERGNLLLTVTAVGTSAAVTVLDETLYAVDGRINLCELGALIEPYVRQYQELTLNCTFDDGTPVSITPVTVFYANADVGMDAASFVSSHFLTTLSGEKVTSLLRDEFLYARGATTVTVTAKILLASGAIQTLTASLSAEATNVVSRFRVSADTVASAISLPTGATLISYSVTAGNRVGRVRRKAVSAVEVWAECFGRDPAAIKRADTYDIFGMLMKIGGWEKYSGNRNGSMRRPPYGPQRCYIRTGSGPVDL